MLSIFEITNGQVSCGLSRFLTAVVRSYGLAFGAFIGVGLATYGGDERFDAILVPCSAKTHQIDNKVWLVLFWPLCAISVLMQMRVAMRHYLLCAVIQTCAYGFQVLFSNKMNYSNFTADVFATFITAVIAEVCLVILRSLRLNDLEVTTKSIKRPDETRSLETVEDNGANGETHEDHHIRAETLSFVESSIKHQWTIYPRIDLQSFDNQGDVWFCLIPALYMLVPGSSLLESAFKSLWYAAFNTSGSMEVSVNIIASLFLIGFSQVMGLKLAFFVLKIVYKIIERMRGWRRKG